MRISLGGKTNANFRPIEFNKFEEIIPYITKENWSPSVYENNHRNLKFFKETEIIGLDIDNSNPNDNYTIEDAVIKFKDYKHIIMPSPSHRKPKDGVVKDRFRILIFTDGAIKLSDDFKATWFKLKEFYPAIDDSCKDASRFFYASPSVYSTNETGKLWPVTTYVKPEVEEIDLILGNRKEKGRLAKATLEFLLTGGVKGKRNDSLFKAAKDMQEQGYTLDETIAECQKMASTCPEWAQDHLSQKDLVTINSAFNNEPRHRPRLNTQNGTFTFKSIADIFNEKERIQWCVDGLLTQGGFSIVVGDPKAGKSTLIRQLARDISRGEPFLGRSTIKSNVIYIALEEQTEMLREQLMQLGITETDNIQFHIGGKQSNQELADLKSAIEDFDCKFVVIDTLFHLANVETLNDYSTVNRVLGSYRDLARQTGCHIMAIHHINKPQKGVSTGSTHRILGSNAIHGAVDNAMIFAKEGDRRFLTSSQRGGKSFNNQELIYNPETNSYTLGAERNEEF